MSVKPEEVRCATLSSAREDIICFFFFSLPFFWEGKGINDQSELTRQPNLGVREENLVLFSEALKRISPLLPCTGEDWMEAGVTSMQAFSMCPKSSVCGDR